MSTPVTGYLKCILAELKNPSSDKDPEVVCFSDDGGNTIVGGYIVFDTSVTPPTAVHYDFNNTKLVGYSVVDCGKNLETEKTIMCDDGTTFIRRAEIEDGKPTGNSFDTNIDLTPYTVTGTPTVGVCAIDPTNGIVGTEILNATSSVQSLTAPANAEYAIGQVLGGSMVLTVDGTTPVEGSNGYIEACKFTLETKEEINNFKYIGSSKTNNSSISYITYYDGVVDTGGF